MYIYLYNHNINYGKMKILNSQLKKAMNIDNEYSEEDIINVNTDSEDDVPKFNEKKRKRKNTKKQNIQIGRIRDVKNRESYKIENIISHKFKDNDYVFLVKWKGYTEKYNSWIKAENSMKQICWKNI